MGTRLALLAALTLTWVPRPGRAEPCPGPPALAGVNAEARLRFLELELAGAARSARRWSWGWGLGYGTVAAAQLSIAPFLDDEGRQADFYVGGGRTALAVVPFLIKPLPVLAAARRLPVADRSCAGLLATEEALARAAAGEARGKSWIKHTLVVGLNVTAGLVLGLGFDRWSGAALVTGSGLLVGEIMIWTQPTRSVDAQRRYRAGQLGLAPPPPAVTWWLAPTGGHDHAGLAFGLAF